MTPEHWRRLEEIYHAALARGESERTAFLADACAAMRRCARVESYSTSRHRRTGSWTVRLWPSQRGGWVKVQILTTNPRSRCYRRLVSPMWRRAPHRASRRASGWGPIGIERLLGRGGVGEVYEAEHLEHGRRIALKVLSQGLSDATDRARFLREGQLAAAVSHPHSVYVYGSEESREYL